MDLQWALGIYKSTEVERAPINGNANSKADAGDARRQGERAIIVWQPFQGRLEVVTPLVGGAVANGDGASDDVGAFDEFDRNDGRCDFGREKVSLDARVARQGPAPTNMLDAHFRNHRGNARLQVAHRARFRRQNSLTL